ncbi:MAG: glycosyltransferase family 4 protein [Chloroflexi bacterium]|nr:glycosyltransferase family 4 protein [Chloroflexota bacterium]
MRIGIDASRAVSPERTGTENYSLQLIRHLLAAAEQEAPASEFVLYCNRAPARGLFSSDNHHTLRVMPFPRLWTHLRLSWEMLLHAPDVLFVPAHVIPVVHPRASVATIHDLGHLYFPEAYPKETLKYLTWATEQNVRAAAHLLADSQATRADLIRHYSVPPERVTVVYPGVSPLFTQEQDPAELGAVRLHYNLQEPYVLYVGTLHPRKNVTRLIEAFARAKREGRLQERLVLAGRMGWLPEEILRSLQQVGEAVTLLGYVPDDHLPALYGGATAFVLPSLFEGFGMPVLEAMACGTPVIAADSSSLPEVVGDAGVLVDPQQTDELAEALAWVCGRQELREQLRQKGLARVRVFTWEAAALKTLAVLDRVGGA